MDERINEPEKLPSDIWVVKPESDVEARIPQQERIETKQNALRAVMDGVAPGIIYDASLMRELTTTIQGAQESLVTTYSLTTYKDIRDNPIYEIVVNKLNYAGHLLSDRSIGYVSGSSIDNGQTTDSQVIN